MSIDPDSSGIWGSEMGDKSLLAKLHDILKLSGIGKYHTCPDLLDGIAEINPEIRGFLKHHCVRSDLNDRKKKHKTGCNPFPAAKESLYLKFADICASKISRKLEKSGYKSYETFRVWKDIKKNKDELNKESQGIVQCSSIVDELKNATDLNVLYQKYEKEFILRSEDKDHCPFASLHIHNELTAIWFSYFLQKSDYFEAPEVIKDTIELSEIMDVFSEKKISLVRLKLNVNSKISRLRDAKVFNVIPQLLKDVSNKLKGAVIYHLSEEILFISTPDDLKDIEQKAKEILSNKTNYYLEITVVDTSLKRDEFLNNYNKLFGDYEMNLYPQLDGELIPLEGNEASHRAIICDMCQMAPASKIYPQEVYGSAEIEPLEEFLCEGCLEVRREADKALNLAKWENEDDASVAFFKVTLNMPELIDLLKEMFISTFNFEKVFDEDLGFSIIKEFLYDYTKFLSSFKDNVFKHEDYGDPANHEPILDNLFCIKIKKDKDIKPLVMEYAELLCGGDFFGQMVGFAEKNKRTLPIKLSVTTSNVKYPFMEHWQALDSPKEDINIYAVPHTRLSISLSKYACLKDAGIEDKRVSSALHKLAEIEERTKNMFLVTVSMLGMKNDLKELARYLITTKELSINETLAFYKIMKD
ncbi:MAG: hypothetical protein FJ241_11110 [Nitrospira sp.]|nr:hypothetical protein [Nitrospira sp.]